MRVEAEIIAATNLTDSTILLSSIQKILIRIGLLVFVTLLLCFRKDDLLLNQVYRIESSKIQCRVKEHKKNKPGILPKIKDILEILNMRNALNMDKLTVGIESVFAEGEEYLKEFSEATAEETNVADTKELSEIMEEDFSDMPDRIEEHTESNSLSKTEPEKKIGEPYQTVIGENPNPPDHMTEEEKPGNSDHTIEDGKPGNSDQTVEEEKPNDSIKDEEKDDVYPIAVNGFLIDAERMIVGVDVDHFAVEDGYLELPGESCVGIRKDAFSGCPVSVVEIFIPENLTVIENGAFCNMPELEWLEVSPVHPVYTSVAGVVYDRDVSTLLVFPGARTGTFEVPESVKRIESFAMDHTSLSGLDMRKCGEVELAPDVFGSGTGEGIRVLVDGEREEYYRNLFAPYSVEILGYSH